MCVHVYFVSVAIMPTHMLPKRGNPWGEFWKEQDILTDQQRDKRGPPVCHLLVYRNGKIPNLKFQDLTSTFHTTLDNHSALKRVESLWRGRGGQQQWRRRRRQRQRQRRRRRRQPWQCYYVADPEMCLFTVFLSPPLSLCPSLFSCVCMCMFACWCACTYMQKPEIN